MSRGTRPYNEDAYQAGVIEMPAFAKKAPMTLTWAEKGVGGGEGTSAESASGDPQVFYFGVFDGHGGTECSAFLKDRLHQYIESSATQFELGSSLKRIDPQTTEPALPTLEVEDVTPKQAPKQEKAVTQEKKGNVSEASTKDLPLPGAKDDSRTIIEGEPPRPQEVNKPKAMDLERALITQWRDVVGGYFRRFKPEFFSLGSGGRGQILEKEKTRLRVEGKESAEDGIGIEAVMTYAFLKADLDFVTAQAERPDEDAVQADRALNDGDILGEASRTRYDTKQRPRFKGGSTCSVAMISTPTPTPFWHPASPSTLIVAHVGDTRILLCSTGTGAAIPLTTNHHPSSPGEGNRLRRYAATFVTDSFGEERMTGLANTRSFGDVASKRIGVSAEPEIRRLELRPAEYSFLMLVSDGISGTLSDQEAVDIVKEARTPEQGARDVVNFATEVSQEGDNATCLVVRLGGWERRSEGGLGAMGTKETRDWRRQEATDPRSRRT
ncbi:MAG: hypothetical protein M1817_002371 [Caeruleum heppii]|nr:MAG: hypothetical protein M1817_002371 [Caeruleum heppii]